MLSFFSIHAITFEGLNFTSIDNSSIINFDVSISMSSLEIGQDYIYLHDIDLVDCDLFSYNVTSIYHSSSFSCPPIVINTTQTQLNLKYFIIVALALITGIGFLGKALNSLDIHSDNDSLIQYVIVAITIILILGIFTIMIATLGMI